MSPREGADPAAHPAPAASPDLRDRPRAGSRCGAGGRGRPWRAASRTRSRRGRSRCGRARRWTRRGGGGWTCSGPRADELVVRKRRATEGVERRKEQLQAQIGRVLPLSRALAAAHRQVQEAREGLSGEKARLGDLQRLLRTKQRSMVGQVAACTLSGYSVNRRLQKTIVPTLMVRIMCRWHGTLPEQNGVLPHRNGNGTHLLGVAKSPQVCHLTFFGWQIARHKTKQQSYTHKELQRSAAVLGYAAHAVLLIASYLDVPLRYPLRFGGSRSYVSDRLPSAETSSVASAEHPSISSADSKLTDYPLFLEFQDDSTRASYAIYLLHKDTEQLLNYIGAESSGRNVFGNLRELIRIIQSDEYLYI
ncbi:hypothetical protein ACQ4PT_044043 [Festuca glaucescens]